MAATDKPRNSARRRFLGRLAARACGVALLATGLVIFSRQTKSLPAQALRPPGALAEQDFLGTCIRCGLCVRACPYDILKLSRLGDEVINGTPYFTARDIPCEMCEDIPCVAACPTGALDKGLTNIDDARMGLAVLVDHETCLNYLGLRCEVCFRICPLINKAITLETRHNVRTGKHTLFIPTVHADACTGCGKCEKACVLPEAAIKVLPMHLAKGKLGEHYRLGWEEQRKAGKSLVAPDEPHKFNLPEGYRYDYDRQGLIKDEKLPQTPFSDDPLETLNKKPGAGQ